MSFKLPYRANGLRLVITFAMGVCICAFQAGCGHARAVSLSDDPQIEIITLLFTNDLESAYDPIPAYWRDDLNHIGGIAELTTLIRQIRAREPNVFLFDSGDIFTGTLSKLTQGELAFELMLSMGYDAMCIGNHEFEYGWEAFAEQKNRASFPVLGANLNYRNTAIPYAQPYTIIERDGIRIGVIGIMGQDAATALIPSNIAGVQVRNPAPAVSRYVGMLTDSVDLIIVLTHQGKTAPMQTDDEGRPEVQRDIEADLQLAGSVPGIDILLGGHADAGTREPVVHPDTGTLIMQTFGQGQHLGYLQVHFNRQSREIESHDGKLIAVDSENLQPDATVADKLKAYRSRYPEMLKIAGHTASRFNRQYNQESDLGNLFADIVRNHAGTDVGLMPSGALRMDLPKGPVTRMSLLDAFPFTDRVAILEVSGMTLRALVEQGLSLERGILQVSGMTVEYDPERPVLDRIRSIKIGNRYLDDKAQYSVATVEILAQGGDKYGMATQALSTQYQDTTFAAVLEAYFESQEVIGLPSRNRLIPM